MNFIISTLSSESLKKELKTSTLSDCYDKKVKLVKKELIHRATSKKYKNEGHYIEI